MDTAPSEVELVMLAEARNEVGAADHKASMVLAVTGIGLGALLGGLLARDWQPGDLNIVGQLAWWPGAALSALSVGSAVSAVWPRFTVSRRSSPEVFYWGHVATYETLEALGSALDENPPRLEDRTRHQLLELSRIVARKYRLVRLSILSACAAAPLFLVASAVGY